MQDPREVPFAALPEQLRLLEMNGRDLIDRGRHDEAEQVFRQILDASPRHIQALQYLAGRALQRQDLDSAQTLLERAIRTAPHLAMLHQNLGVVLRARGFLEGALLAFDTALARRPELGMLWIQRGDVLAALGETEDALASYRQGQFLLGDLRSLAASAPPRNRKALERGASALLEAQLKVLNEALQPLRRRHAFEALEKAESALRTIIHDVAPAYPDPLQRPAFAYFPGIEAKPFYARETFEYLGELEAATTDIAAELGAVIESDTALDPYVDLPVGNERQWRELNRSTKWTAYHLYRNGERVAEHCERCPVATRLIESLPLPYLQGHAPEVFFSILQPGTHIPPHHGLANYKLVAHLPLVIPPGCAIKVGDEVRGWVPGQCLVFDDSFEHEAWNRSEQWRAVLILDVWHPQVCEAEKEALARGISALDRFTRRLQRQIARRPPAPAAG